MKNKEINTKNSKKIAILLIFSIIFLILIIDLLSKHFFTETNQVLIPGVIKLFYTQNTGAAWSIFEGNQTMLIIISVLSIILIKIYAFFEKSNYLFLHVSLGFILGGALGNLFDRVIFGYVRDFIKFEFINFPVFNIADAFLTIGVFFLIISYIILMIRDSKNEK